MVLEHVRPGRVRGRSEVGMSLVEALVAMALLLLVSIGILPLFTRSMVNNAAGSEATSVANHARHRLEEFAQLPFNNDLISITGGNQVLISDHYFGGDHNVIGDEAWGTSGSGAERRDRTTRVRQFSFSLIADNDVNDDGIIDRIGGLLDEDEDGEFDNPLGPTPDLESIHVKEFSVELVNPRDDPSNPRSVGPLGAAPAYRVRSFRAF